MSVSVSFILYAIPFVLAAAVLINVKIKRLDPSSEAEEDPVATYENPSAEAVPERPIFRQYISFTT